MATNEILGVFGRNGCGKSTLLKMIFGSLKADEIKISIDGEKWSPSQNIRRQTVAYLPQHSFLPQNIKVRDIIPICFSEELPAQLREEKQDAIFYDPLIATITAKNVGALSLGQSRYFEVLVLANLDHPFLLLDEPFSMIEPLYKIHIKDYLNQIKLKKGIVITDHYYEDVLDISTQNTLIKNGVSHYIKDKSDLGRLEYLGKNFT